MGFEPESTVKALVTQMDPELRDHYTSIATQLRAGGINTEVFYQKTKFGKQMKYADKAGIRFGIIVGRDEYEAGQVTVKDLVKSEQFQVPLTELVEAVHARLNAD